jgi:hypothetical protein
MLEEQAKESYFQDIRWVIGAPLNDVVRFDIFYSQDNGDRYVDSIQITLVYLKYGCYSNCDAVALSHIYQALLPFFVIHNVQYN